MGSGGKQRSKGSTHHLFKTKQRNRVDDLQGMFYDLQQARNENRATDVSLLEEQVHQMLREWKAELNEASPASSLLVASPCSSELSSDMKRLLQLCEEDDDACSNLAACLEKLPSELQEQHTLASCESPREYVPSGVHAQEEMLVQTMRSEIDLIESSQLSNDESLAIQAHLRSPQVSLQEPFSPNITSNGFCCSQNDESPTFQFVVSPPPSAFLGPKCALWDCPRPAHGSDWYQDYCSSFHASLAVTEGAPGMCPVVRPGGIDLKDGPLFSALSARSHDKAVGVPECGGAATSKSPWNAQDLFDITVLQGELMREWLFFDKPRRAFESGTRKQRSLPDYNGRGWHESRKQVMKDMGGLKRSYYMDPQPDSQFEWHLYEYELSDCDARALYRLELKQVNGSKKSSKAKGQNDQVAALQNQIGKLSADLSAYDGKVCIGSFDSKTNKGRLKSTQKGGSRSPHFETSKFPSMGDNHVYGNNTSFGYVIEDMTNYFAIP